MARREELTDEQWELIAALIPAPVRRPDGRGRPWRANREGVKRDSLDLTLGGTLARLPRALSPVPDLPSALLAVGASGRPAQGLRSLSREFTHARGVGPQRVLYRCDLHWGEKKDGTWEQPNGAKVRNSWRWQTALVFRSPSTRRLLHRMKSPWSTRLFSGVFSPSGPSA